MLHQSASHLHLKFFFLYDCVFKQLEKFRKPNQGFLFTIQASLVGSQGTVKHVCIANSLGAHFNVVNHQRSLNTFIIELVCHVFVCWNLSHWAFFVSVKGPLETLQQRCFVHCPMTIQVLLVGYRCGAVNISAAQIVSYTVVFFVRAQLC